MKLRITAIVAFAAVILVATGAWAQSGDSRPGEAPFGINAQSNAKGTKISGPLYIELLDLDGFVAVGGARAAVRLRRNNAMTMAYVEIPGPIPFLTEDDITALTDSLLDALAEEILVVPLFPDGCPDCTVRLKQAEQFEFLDVQLSDLTFSRIILLDVTLAVQ